MHDPHSKQGSIINVSKHYVFVNYLYLLDWLIELNDIRN